MLKLVLERGSLLQQLKSAIAALQKAAGERADVPAVLEQRCHKIKEQVDDVDEDILVGRLLFNSNLHAAFSTQHLALNLSQQLVVTCIGTYQCIQFECIPPSAVCCWHKFPCNACQDGVCYASTWWLPALVPTSSGKHGQELP